VPSFECPPPAFASQAEYQSSLTDVGFWTPYVAEVLARHGLPVASVEVGTPGSFPTFLAGDYVVKLVGELFWGPTCHAVELSIGQLLARHSEIPAPRLVAHGQVFDPGTASGWSWPYLIVSRLSGVSWHEAALDAPGQEHLARQLGRVIRRLHGLPPPPDPVWQRDWLAELRATCVERQRQWGILPARLIDQIASFLPEPSPTRGLIHADLHDHHLFVQAGSLVGIVDWGDALFADPYYELPALHFHTFRGNRRLLAAFLDAYGWRVGADFAHRAMAMSLLYEFNVLDGLPTLVNVDMVGTLSELAHLLWDPAR